MWPCRRSLRGADTAFLFVGSLFVAGEDGRRAGLGSTEAVPVAEAPWEKPQQGGWKVGGFREETMRRTDGRASPHRDILVISRGGVYF